MKLGNEGVRLNDFGFRILGALQGGVMQNASTVIRPRPSRPRLIVPPSPGKAHSWVTRIKLQVAVCEPLQPVHPSEMWTFGEALCLLPQRRSHTEVIERTGYAFSTLLQDVGVDHGVDRGEVIAAVNSLELFNR